MYHTTADTIKQFFFIIFPKTNRSDLNLHLKGFVRTGINTVTAADALTAVRLNAGIDVHLACLGAGIAVDAL